MDVLKAQVWHLWCWLPPLGTFARWQIWWRPMGFGWIRMGHGGHVLMDGMGTVWDMHHHNNPDHTIMILCISHGEDHNKDHNDHCYFWHHHVLDGFLMGAGAHGWKLSSKPCQGRTVKLLIHCRVLYPIIIWHLYPHFWRVLGGSKWMLYSFCYLW